MQVIAQKSYSNIRPYRDAGTLNDFTIRYRYLIKNLSKENSFLYAEPLKSGNKFVWRTPLSGKITNYPELDSQKKKEVEQLLSQAINVLLAEASGNDDLEKRIDIYKNIPSQDDIYLVENNGQQKVVLTQWGCTKDDSQGSHFKIKADDSFPVPVVFKILYNDDQSPASNQEVYIEFNNKSNLETANDNGLIDFGKVIKGKKLSAYQIIEDQKRHIHDFTCDGREFYIVEVTPLQTMKFIVKDTNGEIQTNYSISCEYSGNNKNFNTDENGNILLENIKVFTKVQCWHQENDQKMYVHDFECEENRELYEIIIPAPKIETPPPPPPKEEEPKILKVKLIDHKNNPVVNRKMTFTHRQKEYELVTDNDGYCILELEQIDDKEDIDVLVKKVKKESKKRKK